MYIIDHSLDWVQDTLLLGAAAGSGNKHLEDGDSWAGWAGNDNEDVMRMIAEVVGSDGVKDGPVRLMEYEELVLITDSANALYYWGMLMGFGSEKAMTVGGMRSPERNHGKDGGGVHSALVYDPITNTLILKKDALPPTLRAFIALSLALEMGVSKAIIPMCSMVMGGIGECSYTHFFPYVVYSYVCI